MPTVLRRVPNPEMRRKKALSTSGWLTSSIIFCQGFGWIFAFKTLITEHHHFFLNFVTLKRVIGIESKTADIFVQFCVVTYSHNLHWDPHLSVHYWNILKSKNNHQLQKLSTTDCIFNPHFSHLADTKNTVLSFHKSTSIMQELECL